MTHLWNVLTDAAREETRLNLPLEGTGFPFRELLASAERTAGQIGAELAARGRTPRRIGILMNNGEPWVRGLLAALRLDAAAVPLPLPVAFAGAKAYADHLRRIAEKAELDAVLVDGSLGRLEGAVAAEIGAVALIDIARVPETGGPAAPVGPGGDALAVIQFTSGSTSAPKGVTLTHSNVLAGLEAILSATDWQREDALGLWLPLFHDMGLFSMLASLSVGSTVHLWKPSDFIRRPLKWLQSFSDARATSLPAPNFFYELLAKTAAEQGVPEGIDLSYWRTAGNGAEPVQARTLEEFTATFAPYGFPSWALLPLYGMAEATLIVTGTPHGGRRSLTVDRDRLGSGNGVRFTDAADARARTVVSCGTPVANIRLRIGDGTGAALPDGTVGEIQITGPAVTGGYLDLPVRDQPFTPDGWLRTGDLAFLHEGEVYVIGRAKDLIIVHGQNFYAEDVEEIVRTAPGLDKQRCAAFAWNGDGAGGGEGPERMVVLYETSYPSERLEALSASIRERLVDHLGLDRVEVRPVSPSSIPFTTSGKVKRHDARRLLAAPTSDEGNP
ncbi:AMP-binding protein [Streptomyces sp. NPDC046876]|uniref:AMP-binding protein n=1 Tax=Streptomyces sp. NPDC046876 TaxID=3155616 RepID=UPI00340780AF